MRKPSEARRSQWNSVQSDASAGSAMPATPTHTTGTPVSRAFSAKRIGKRFGDRKADVKGAAELLSEETVMSSREARKAVELLESNKTVARSGRNKDLIGALTDRAKGVKTKKSPRKRAAKAR